MTSPGYENVEEQFIESSEAHFAELENNLAEFISSSDSHFEEVEKSIADYVSTSDNHFMTLDQNSLYIQKSELEVASFESEAIAASSKVAILFFNVVKVSGVSTLVKFVLISQ